MYVSGVYNKEVQILHIHIPMQCGHMYAILETYIHRCITYVYTPMYEYQYIYTYASTYCCASSQACARVILGCCRHPTSWSGRTMPRSKAPARSSPHSRNPTSHQQALQLCVTEVIRPHTSQASQECVTGDLRPHISKRCSKA